MLNKEIAKKECERNLEIWKDWWPARIDPDLYDHLLEVIDRFEDKIGNPVLVELISNEIEDVFAKGYVTEKFISTYIRESEIG